MKSKIDLLKRYIVVLMVVVGIPFAAKAQHFPDELNFKLDWQVNAPLGYDYADKLSGWGMNFEVAYEVSERWSLGAFASIHTNHGYAGRETIQLSPNEALTTDQLHSAFQVPFGALASFDLAYTPHFRPYVAGKIGAMYEQNTTYLNNIGFYERPWGLYVSPEIGLNIYPQRYGRFGFHVAVYYSYATNDTQLLNYQEDGKHSVGFRLGICF